MPCRWLSHPGLKPTLALGATSALSVCMVLLRAVLTGRLVFTFVLWNLFLAWVPLCCALLARHARGRLALVTLTATWLLFLPNAPYVLTDMMHFGVREVPYWYDLILLLTFAWTGTLAGFLSLYLMHTRVSERIGWPAGWLFALGALGLSAFGIFLGRFERWNSWDIVLDPSGLAIDIWHRVRHPLANIKTYEFTLLMGAFLVCAYITLVAFTRIPQDSSIK